jgi:intraflagellar transport protein 74
MGTRQGTATQKQPGIGTLTEVKISERPMTMQGVSGMKTGSFGPKRQIYDKTYYVVELGKRCRELADEVTKLNKEISETQQDNQHYAALEKRYDSLVKTVRSLEGDLADHNLATDKQRTDTRPEEVHHMYMLMKSQNEQQRSDVDQIFLEKRSHEDEIARMDQEISAIARSAEERLNELHPDQRREYEDLREESNRLGADLADAREELDQVTGRLNSEEGILHGDILRSRSAQLSSMRKELAERLGTLEVEVQQCNMTIPEQREHLLAKVKNDNAEIITVEKKNSELKLANQKLKTSISEVLTDAQEKKDESSDQQKYEILFAKDNEMSQFINEFDVIKAEEEKKMKDKQESIINLLQNISKSQGLPTDPESHLTDMQEELDFKNKQLQNSETTHNRLEAELAKREGELEKIESLDVKISLELQQVEAKMRQYEHDMETKYDLVADMQARGSDQLRRLEAQKQFSTGRVSALRQQVHFLKITVDSRQQQLRDDEGAAKLEAHEQKIRQFGQTLHTLRSFIAQKCNESDFGPEMSNCFDMSAHINKILQGQKLAAGA